MNNKKLNIALIVATSKNKVIGNNGMLPWSIPSDLARFKRLTKDSTLIMGRKTFDSLPAHKLPGRSKIVLSRNPLRDHSYEDTVFVESKEKALMVAEFLGKPIFVCGGASVYSDFINDCTKAYITYIDHNFEGDTFFPDFSICQWHRLESEEFYNYDINNHNNNFEYRMEIWQKTPNMASCS